MANALVSGHQNYYNTVMYRLRPAELNYRGFRTAFINCLPIENPNSHDSFSRKGGTSCFGESLRTVAVGSWSLDLSFQTY